MKMIGILRFDIACNRINPGGWGVVEFIALFPGQDGRIILIEYARDGVLVVDDGRNIGIEIVNDGGIGIEIVAIRGTTPLCPGVRIIRSIAPLIDERNDEFDTLLLCNAEYIVHIGKGLTILVDDEDAAWTIFDGFALVTINAVTRLLISRATTLIISTIKFPGRNRLTNIMLCNPFVSGYSLVRKLFFHELFVHEGK